MSKKAVFIISLVSFFALLNNTYASETFISSCDKTPSNYLGRAFKLKTDYPSNLNNVEKPWEKVSFQKKAKKYADAVLLYIYQGNISSDFYLEQNTVRNWYHAPWMHYGTLGREFMHGLTREKSCRPGQLHPNQKSKFQNWAVSIINDAGGYTYGQIWKDPNNPTFTKVEFPNGTVSAKLIFTEATPDEVPYLKHSPEWVAYINNSDKGTDKVFKTLRLLQIDFAVKDHRSKSTGWVMGTFVYDSDLNNENSWLNMVPIGITWGNDPSYTKKDKENNNKLSETWINDKINKEYLGYLGRLNGPVDNKNSSCMSCHSTSQMNGRSSSVPSLDISQEEIAYWFRNIKSDQAFDDGAITLDYSKQLQHGIMNFYEARAKNDKTGCATFNSPVKN